MPLHFPVFNFPVLLPSRSPALADFLAACEESRLLQFEVLQRFRRGGAWWERSKIRRPKPEIKGVTGGNGVLTALDVGRGG